MNIRRAQTLLALRHLGLGLTFLCVAIFTGAISSWSFAQENEDALTDKKRKIRGGVKDEVETFKISGTKKVGGQSALEAPVAVTTFTEEQLDAYRYQDIESLTFSIPAVSLDTPGTQKGIANFTIRGLGTNSSIPSIDPTVGFFVNGVYFGSNAGAVLDTFDLEGIEVLRGPQGILFGRNVTGGAVLLRTRRPGDTFGATLKTSIETGLEYRLQAAVDVPIWRDKVALRVAGHYRSDEGWFTNLAPGEDATPEDPLDAPSNLVEESFGAEDTWILRPTLSITPFDELEIHVMYEHGDTEGQGAPSQSAAEAAPPYRGTGRGFFLSIDEPGLVTWDWNQVFIEATLALGQAGRLVNIFGWRAVEHLGLTDIDAQPRPLFSIGSGVNLEHISNEFRYSGKLFSEHLYLTSGLYFFVQDLVYRERRVLAAGALDTSYGGDQSQVSFGVFSQLEIEIARGFALILGGRITQETKEARIYRFNPASGPCEAPPSTRCVGTPFVDDADWLNFSPKIGFRLNYSGDNLLYGHWTRGFRSGGYNVRFVDDDPSRVPSPFDEEQQDVFELGLKGQVAERRVRYGIAGYFMSMSDLQRELTIRSGAGGVFQAILNPADANVYGGELELSLFPAPNTVVNASFGYTDANYTDVRFDLNNIPPIDAQDRALQLPRLANMSVNLRGVYDIFLGTAGVITLRADYSYRDNSFFTDDNIGRLPSGNIFNASISYVLPVIETGEVWLLPKINIYGRNLLNEVFFGGQTPLIDELPIGSDIALGGNISTLKEGRVIGAELRLDWH